MLSPLEQAAHWATLVGAPVAVVALTYAALQLRRSVIIARGQFMLELEKMISLHDPTHRRLRPGGSWSGGGGPATAAEWSEVEDYMGFFEHCELLLEDGSLKMRAFKALFGYRVRNIVANTDIAAAKLKQEASSWELFLRLLDRLGIARP
jgi:hypothetical protein